MSTGTMPRRAPWALVGVTVALLGAGTAVAWWGIRAGPTAAPVEAVEEPEAPPGLVYTLVLPHEEPSLPPGPNRERVQVSCTVCHSTRLALTQPRLTGKQWEGVVHKMVAVYGAPLSLDEEKEIVAYLEAVRGKEAAR